MWKVVLAFILSTKTLGANFAMDLGVGFGRFDELNVPYGANSFFGGLEPRADGSISRNDIKKRFGLGIEASVFRSDKLSYRANLTNRWHFLQISGVSGTQDSTITGSSFDRIGWHSLVHLDLEGFLNSRFQSSLVPAFVTGIGVQRTNWRNVSTGHLLDSANVVAGIEYAKGVDWHFSLVGEKFLFGRFAWDDQPFNLSPRVMHNIDISHQKIDLKLSYFKLKSLSFHGSVAAEVTSIKFNDLQKSYAESGLEINPLVSSVQSRILGSYSIMAGFARLL